MSNKAFIVTQVKVLPMKNRVILVIISLVCAGYSPRLAQADWKIYYRGALQHIAGSGGQFAPGIGRGSFDTQNQCEDYRKTRPLSERNDSYCLGFDTSSHSPTEPGGRRGDGDNERELIREREFVHQKELMPMKIKASLSDAAKYEVPRGWAEEFSLNQGDPQALISRELHEIKVRLSGGGGSRYQTAGDFLVGFEALSTGGKRAEETGAVVVSGMRVMVYRREVPVRLPPPGEGGPSFFKREEFCVVPAGKMFFILSYSYGDSIPDLAYNGLKAWHKFLKNFRVLEGEAGK
jgi:hypothetical protein